MKVKEDETFVYFSAVTPGFSYFAIAGEESSGYAEEQSLSDTEPIPVTPAPSQETVPEKPSPKLDVESSPAPGEAQIIPDGNDGTSKKNIMALLLIPMIGAVTYLLNYMGMIDIESWLKKR